MKTKDVRWIRAITALGLLAAGFITASAAVKPATGTASDVPAIWQQAGPQERLKTLRVAEVDALRLLTERVYGVQLNSETTVFDLLLRDDDLRAQVVQTIKGVATTEEPEYLEDGAVQVVRAVKLRQVLETITRTITRKQTAFGDPITVSDVEKMSREKRDVVIDIMGNGALPGSPGLRKIQAKRAAEMDGYRKLAERLMGVRVTSATTVKDCVLQSDKIRACAAQLIKGAKPVSIKYLADESCDLGMQIKVADIFRVIRKYSKADKELLSVERDYETTTFTETGHGAPRAAGAGPTVGGPTSDMEAMDGVYQETEIIIKQLVGQGVVIK
ncbi:MAG: hypothetical protein HY343_12725 [Lentisphaerae bacterium]|nr:hypothetical protein [Lentisphaerota bacterium]